MMILANNDKKSSSLFKENSIIDKKLRENEGSRLGFLLIFFIIPFF